LSTVSYTCKNATFLAVLVAKIRGIDIIIEPKNKVKNGSHTLGPTHYVGSYISGYLRCIERISDDEQRLEKEVELTPTSLSTTVRHIYDRVPNSVNSKLIEDFHSYMKGNATSERH
jgi:hypothetical protein